MTVSHILFKILVIACLAVLAFAFLGNMFKDPNEFNAFGVIVSVMALVGSVRDLTSPKR